MTAYVVSAGMTRFGRYPDRSLRDLASAALDDVVAKAPSDLPPVEIVFASNAVAGTITGQENLRGQVMLRHAGFRGAPIVNVENACASGSTALHLAISAVEAQEADVALAIGAERLTHSDRTRTLRAFETSVDLADLPELEALVGITPEESGSRSLFMDLYAAGYADGTHGSAPFEERDLALVAVKNRQHAAHNPYAQYRDPITIEDVLTSRTVAGRLRLLMCCPVGDGAAAAIVVSERIARRVVGSKLKVRASSMRSGRFDDPTMASASVRASRAAFEKSECAPEDLDFVELHDAASPAELHAYADITGCDLDTALARLRDGSTTVGGRQPVNPSGGLLSRGHPIGATGLAQVAEVYSQLRQDAGNRQVANARLALTHNVGGFIGTDAAIAVVHIFERE